MKNVNGGVLVVEVLIVIFFLIPQVDAAETSRGVTSSSSIEISSGSAITSGSGVEITSGSSIITFSVTTEIEQMTDEYISEYATMEQMTDEYTSEQTTMEQMTDEYTSEQTTIEQSTDEHIAEQKTEIYRITGYCGCFECCEKTDCITASGRRAQSGRTIAMDPSVPFGTHVLINGDEYIVEDRGGAIKGNRIDIFFDSHQEGEDWGVQYLPVAILD